MSYKKWVLVAVSLFGVGLVVGVFTPLNVSLAREALASLEELGRLLAPFSILTAVLIFIKNASALVFSFILSPLLCLVPIISLTINGCIISLVSTIVVEEESLGFLLVGLLPHGVFELPAFIIGQAAALSFGAMAILALFSKKKRGLLPGSLKQNLKYLALALVLLLPAAIIETYVTPWLLT
ncbi:MAG TPA: stage II sporulation protein M [Dehalococcoidales bacterium]|nr:stage II sporulation protein M [Dehalococcoidales bacterium]